MTGNQPEQAPGIKTLSFFWLNNQRIKSSVDFENYKHVQNKAANEIRKSIKAEVDNVAKNLEGNKLDINPKDWWKT